MGRVERVDPLVSKTGDATVQRRWHVGPDPALASGLKSPASGRKPKKKKRWMINRLLYATKTKQQNNGVMNRSLLWWRCEVWAVAYPECASLLAMGVH